MLSPCCKNYIKCDSQIRFNIINTSLIKLTIFTPHTCLFTTHAKFWLGNPFLFLFLNQKFGAIVKKDWHVKPK